MRFRSFLSALLLAACPLVAQIANELASVATVSLAARHPVRFIPQVLDLDLLDGVVTVPDEQAFATTRDLAEFEGLMCGISSGAAAWAALQVATRPENEGKTVVVILPDLGERYLSLRQLCE